jgi:uncharacterized membrane protein
MKGPQMNTPRQTGKGNPRCALMAAAFAFTALAIAPLGDRAVFGQCNYELTAIIAAADCDTGPSVTFAQGLNLHGHVVGYYWPCAIGNDRAFFWSQETGFVTLPTPPDVYRAWAYAISDTGLIVGQHGFAGVGNKGFIYDMNKNNGEYIYLEPVHEGVVAQNLSSANAVNSEGVVAGMRVYTEPGVTPARYNAVIWRPFEKGRPVEDLGVIGGPNSSAETINESGEIAGWYGSDWFTTNARAFFWNTREIIELGVLEGSVQSAAFSINEYSEIVGISRAPHPDGGGLPLQSFYWNGQMTQIGWPSGYSTNAVHAISNIGQIVGNAGTPGSNTVAFLTQLPHLVVTKLDELTDGISLSGGRAVNDRGQILAISSTMAALLSPTDVPFADLNLDCKVDLDDLQILLQRWGPIPRGVQFGRVDFDVPSADLNGDGVVNVTDLLILFDHWTN